MLITFFKCSRPVNFLVVVTLAVGTGEVNCLVRNIELPLSRVP